MACYYGLQHSNLWSVSAAKLLVDGHANVRVFIARILCRAREVCIAVSIRRFRTLIQVIPTAAQQHLLPALLQCAVDKTFGGGPLLHTLRVDVIATVLRWLRVSQVRMKMRKKVSDISLFTATRIAITQHHRCNISLSTSDRTRGGAPMERSTRRSSARTWRIS